MLRKGLFFFLPLFLLPSLSAQEDIRADTGPEPGIRKEASPLTDADRNRIGAMADFAQFLNGAFRMPPERGELPEAVIGKLYDVLEKDSSSREVIALVAADLLENPAKKRDRLQRLVRIAERHPENLALNLLAAEFLSGKSDDRALSERNTEQAIALLEKTWTATEIGTARGEARADKLGEVCSRLSLLYASRGEFDKADRTIRGGLRLVSRAKRPELLQTALRVYFDAMNRSSDRKPFLIGWFLGSEKERFTEKFHETASELTEILFSPESHLDSERFLATAAIFGDRGETDLALLILSAPLLEDPENLSALRRMAAFYSVSGDFANAARAWRRVLELRKNPTPFESYLLAFSLQRSGDYGAAAAAFAEHERRFPEDPVPLEQHVLCSYLAEDYETAVRVAGRLSSPSAETLYVKALSEERLGKYSSALRTLLQYLSVRKFSDEEEKYPFSLQTALIADKAGRCDVAASILEPMIDADPENAELLNLLGYLYASAGINLGMAEKLLLEALDLDPDNPAILDSVAWMYFRRGKYRDARIYLERSLAATPKGEVPDSVILDHAGDIYHALGNTEKALSCWKRALRVYSEELDPRKVLKKVEDAEREISRRR